MSGQAEQDSKTEEVTDKRRSETLEREGGPFSREAGSAAVLLVAALFLATAVPRYFNALTLNLSAFIENPGGWRLEGGEDALRLLQYCASTIYGFIGLFAAIITLSAMLTAFFQNSPRFIINRIIPDFSRISPAAGFGRLFRFQAIVELLKGLAKIFIAAIAVYAGFHGSSTGFLVLHSAPEAIPELLLQLCLRVALLCAVMASVVAAVDIIVTRRAWHRALMMSKQEVKEELKQSEGDAAFKARLRTVARSRIKRRMMLNVTKATVVIANPTHYAVALRYVRGEDTAPKVLAKGEDAIALKIREIAERNNIPVIEDKTLAKSLCDATEVDQLIPAEFYKAVAEIIIYLGSRSRKASRSPHGMANGPAATLPLRP